MRAPGAATSVHVYSPALETMTFYGDAPGVFLTPLRTELAEEGHLAA